MISGFQDAPQQFEFRLKLDIPGLFEKDFFLFEADFLLGLFTTGSLGPRLLALQSKRFREFSRSSARDPQLSFREECFSAGTN